MRVRASLGSIPVDPVLSKTAPESLANFQNGSQGSARTVLKDTLQERRWGKFAANPPDVPNHGPRIPLWLV
jgi:hypothetical protein